MNISRLAAAFLVALAPLVLGACAPDSGTFCNDKVCYILNFDKNVAMLVSEWNDHTLYPMTKEGDRYEIDFTASKSGSSTAFFKMVDGNTVVFVGADPSDKEEGYRLKRSGKEQVDALREKFAAKAKKELAADKLQEQQKKLDDLKAIVERNPDEAKKAEGLELIKKEQKKLDDLRAQNKAASDPWADSPTAWAPIAALASA